MPPKPTNIRLRRGLPSSAAAGDPALHGSPSHTAGAAHSSPSTAQQAAAAASSSDAPLTSKTPRSSFSTDAERMEALFKNPHGGIGGRQGRGAAQPHAQPRRGSRLEPLPTQQPSSPPPKNSTPLQTSPPPSPVDPPASSSPPRREETGARRYVRPMLQRQPVTQATREAPAPMTVSSSKPPPQPQPQAPSVAPPAPRMVCSSEAFLRGVELMNAALHVRQETHHGAADPHTQPKHTPHAMAFTSGGAQVGDTDANNKNVHGQLQFQALVPTSQTQQRTLRTVPVLPVWLVTDGSGLLLVDFNGTQKHGNYRAALATAAGQRESTRTVGEGADAYWLDWTRLRKTFAEHEARVMRAARAKPIAVATAAEQQEDLVFPLMDALTAQGTALTSLSLDYASEPLVIFLAAGSRIATEALEDVAQAYLPVFLQPAYPTGVPVHGLWSPTTPMHRTTSADATAPAAVASRQMTSLYPALEADAAAQRARAALGALHLPTSVWQALQQQRQTHTQALLGGPCSASSVCAPTSSVHPPLARADVHNAASPHLAFTGSGHRLGQWEETASHGGAPASVTAPVSDRRLAWLLKAKENASQPPERHGVRLTTSSVPPSSEPRSGGGAPCEDATTASAAPAPSVRHSLGSRAPLESSGPPCEPSQRATHLCQQLTVLTPRGPLLLERRTAAHDNASDARMTTVQDVKQSVMSSAVGRQLGLSVAGFALVYGPGLPPLSEATLLDARAATLRLVRLASD